MHSRPSSISAQPRLILCIDDADIALRVRKLLLSSEGYNVLTAASAERASNFLSSIPSSWYLPTIFSAASQVRRSPER
jgi:CheY-like chemotaxis protein